MSDQNDYQPVRVHVASADPGALDGKAPASCRYRAIYRTIHLTSTDNGHELWADSDDVECALVQALDDDVTIAKTKADAEKGSGYTLAKANTAPTEVHDSAKAWAANATGTFSGGSSTYSRVSVAIFYRVTS